MSNQKIISNSPTDTEILDWLDREVKNKCIATAPSYGKVYANDPIREKEPPFITLHLNGEGFIFNEDGEPTHESLREAIRCIIKREQ